MSLRNYGKERSKSIVQPFKFLTPQINICKIGQISTSGTIKCSVWNRVDHVNRNTPTGLLDILQDIRRGEGVAPAINTQTVQDTTQEPEETCKVWKKRYNEAKVANLQAFTPSCRMRDSHLLTDPTNLLAYNPLFNVDIDVQDNPALFEDKVKIQQFLDALQEDPAVISYWRSVSGGVSILYKTEGKQEQHLNTFLNLQKYFEEQGVTIDKACKNVNRLRFLNYDPNIYISKFLECGRFDLQAAYVPSADLVPKPKAKPKAKAVGGQVRAGDHQVGLGDHQVIAHVLRVAHSKGYRWEDGKKAHFLAHVGGMLNQFGVPLDEAISGLNQVGVVVGDTRIHDIYKQYADQHNTRKFTPYAGQIKPGDDTITNFLIGYKPKALVPVYQAKIGRYLSDFEVPDVDKLILNVPTNCGKTYHFANVATGKRILLVPSVPLAMQVQERYGIKAVFEGVQVAKGDEIMVATYEALPRISQVVNIINFDLYVDEAHAFVQASTKTFRNKPLSYVCELLPFFKKSVLLTGTWIYNNSPLFSDFKIINIQSEAKKVGKLNYVVAKHKIESLKRKIKANTGFKHAIYYNTKAKGEGLAKALKSAKLGTFLVLNSETKNRVDQATFIRTGMLQPEYQGVIFTDVIKEGLGIENKEEFKVHILTKADSVTTEQVINRVRKTVPEAFYYTTTKAKFSRDYHTQEDRLKLENVLRTEAKDRVGVMENTRAYMIKNGKQPQFNYFFRKDDRDTYKHLGEYREMLINVAKNVDDRTTVNELGIINGAYRWYSDQEKLNPKMFLDNMASYGYQIEIVNDTQAENNSLAGVIQEADEERKVEIKNRVDAVLEEFKEGGEPYVQQVFENRKSNGFEKDLAFKYLYLYKRLLNPDDVLMLLNQVGANTRLWNTLRSVLDNQVMINTTLGYKRSTNALIRDYASAFNIGQKYTGKEIYEITKAVHGRHKKTLTGVPSLTQNKAVILFKELFKVGEDKNKNRTYKIIRLGAFAYELNADYSTQFDPKCLEPQPESEYLPF